QTAGSIQTLSEGEGLMQTAGSIQTLSEGEGFDTEDAGEHTEPSALTESATAEVAAPDAPAVINAGDEHRVKMTPDEELLAEAGVSSIAEIKRLMRQEDEDLAEFDDMDEDLEWEVETPQTYR
ncbi:MAG: hypothetical protein JST83_05720, partial [Bacteroidetes bacterium]|nr:hypothetical protein [Bacteroidota bacterium]